MILDGRTLQSTCESGPRARYDGYKRKKGSKVHMAVDTLGLLLAVHVTPANEQERAQVQELAQQVQYVSGRCTKPFLDLETRENVMSSGIAHLSADGRLSYIQFLTKFLDELVPVNCFGEVDMGAAMNTVSLREIYGRPSASDILSTSQQYAFAQRKLSRVASRETRPTQPLIPAHLR